ncbi:UNVERIFIED_CONTAM: variable surface lipoprotein [Campylobacter lari]
MKKINKFLLLGGITTSVVTLPFLAASCNDTTKTDKNTNDKETNSKLLEAQNNYKNASEKYNEKMNEYGKQLKDLYSKLDKAKAKDAKQEANTAITTFINKYRPEVKGLRETATEAFKKLQKIEKEEQSEIVTYKIFNTNDEHGRLEMDNYK